MTPEQLEIMFPIAAASSEVLCSRMTLTQMCSECIKAQEEVQKQKGEKLLLSQQLKQIVEEIHENSPVINQRMQDYHKAVETVSCLQTQLASSLTEQEHLQSERDDATRIAGIRERENARIRTQVRDLSCQVQVLLKELEEARGRRVHMGSRSTGEQEVSSSDQLTAGRVISRHLVTFRDIQEIQTQNQKLLAVVRSLSEQQEEMEKNYAAEDRAKLDKELKEVSAELEKLQVARVKQSEIVETIVHQRDFYRVLLFSQGYSESLLGSPSMASTPLVGEESTQSPRDIRLQKACSALKQLQIGFDTYKKEKAQNTNILNEQLDKVCAEASELQIKAAKLSSQLEYSDERIYLLQTNMDNFKKENASLREKNQKHTNLVSQHQQTINTLRQEITTALEKLAKAEVSVENLKAEKELLKGIEARLLQEKEVMMKHQHQQSRILANLQTAQNNLKRIESESQRTLKSQLDKLEKENAVLRTKVENSNEDYQAAVKVWEKENGELQQKLDREIESNKKLHSDLVDAYAEVHSLKHEIITVKCKAVSSEAQLEKKAIIEQKLESAEKSAEYYRTMSDDFEFRLKQQDEMNKELQTQLRNSLEQANAEKENLEKCVDELEKRNRQVSNDNMKLSQEKNNMHDDLLQKMASLESDLATANESKVEAEKTAIQVREDCQNRLQLMKEAQEKYYRELISHAKDVQQLSILNEQAQATSDAQHAELLHKIQMMNCLTESNQLLRKEKEDLLEFQKELEEKVRKIKRKYKSQYNDVKIAHDELLAKTATSVHSTAEQNLQELQKKCEEMEAKHGDEIGQLQERISKAEKEKEAAASRASEKEEKTKKIFVQLKNLTSDLQGKNEKLQQENDRLSSKVAALETRVTSLTESSDSSPVGLLVDMPAPTTSVIVSPPATQVVTPTVKRSREDLTTPSPPESTESGVHVQKRVRMISNGSQTNQQLSSPGITGSNVVMATVSRMIPSELEASESQVQSRAGASKSSEKDATFEDEGKEALERATEDEDMVDASIEESEEMADQQQSDCIEIIDEVEAKVAAVPASEQALTYASTVPSIKIDGSERTRSDVLESLELAEQSKHVFLPIEADSSFSQVLPHSESIEPQSVINSVAVEPKSYVKIVIDNRHTEDFVEFFTYILPDVMFTVCFHSKSVWVLKFKSPGDAESAKNALNYRKFAGNQSRRVSAVVCSYTEVACYLHHSSSREKK